MKKVVLGVFVLVVMVGLSGCGNKGRENAMSEALEEASSGLDGGEQGNFLIYENETVGATTAAPAMEAVTAGGVGSSVTVPVEVTDKPTNQQIQQALKNAGLYDGAVDGKIGPKTKKAIRKFQIQNELSVDGKVGKRTWAKLSSYLNAAPAASAAPATSEEPSAENTY